VTAIDELSDNLKIYPNPSTGFVNIEMPSSAKNTGATVFNSGGQIVRTLKLQNQINNVDLSDLSKGIYFVKLAGSENNEMKKLVIN
jgi:hypothetical protein